MKHYGSNAIPVQTSRVPADDLSDDDDGANIPTTTASTTATAAAAAVP